MAHSPGLAPGTFSFAGRCAISYTLSAFKLERVAGFAPASRPREGRILLIEPHPRGAPGWDLASGLILRTDALYTLSYGSRETGAGTGIRIRTKTLATSRAALTPHPQEIGAKSPECADAYSSSGRYAFSLNRLGIGVPGWTPTSNLLLRTELLW